MKKITFTFLLASLSFLNMQAQTITSETFDSTGNTSLPANWTASRNSQNNLLVHPDDYYGGCSDMKSLYANLYESEHNFFVTTQTFSNLTNDGLNISYGLRVIDFSSEGPANYNFGNITFSFSLDNGTTWVNMGTVNNTNFTPQQNCQSISYNIPANLISPSSQLKFKWEMSYGENDYEVLIDDFLVFVNQAADVNTLDQTQLKMYPNPTAGILNIEYIDNITELIIMDMSGRVVGNYKGQGKSNKIDVSSLNSGTYLVEVKSSDNAKSTIKFLKK